jgi:hypothetical protein
MSPGISNRSSSTDRSRRGAAEIELLLAIPLLVTILWLIWGTLRIGALRLLTTQSAHYNAFADATVRDTPLIASDAASQDLGALDDGLPALPNRVHLADSNDTLAINPGALRALPRITIHHTAQTISPPLSFSSYPVVTDHQALFDWFTAYADEATADIRYPLGLSDTW